MHMDCPFFNKLNRFADPVIFKNLSIFKRLNFYPNLQVYFLDYVISMYGRKIQMYPQIRVESRMNLTDYNIPF